MRVVPVAALFALLLQAPAAAQDQPDTLTPEGAATLRKILNGPSTLEGRGPEVLVKWTVTVGPGGRPGRVRLRTLDRDTRSATVTGNGAWESLPAEPGTYTFPAPHVRYDYRWNVLALDQEAGGHAIVRKRDGDSPGTSAKDFSMEVFRPPLADDAKGVQPDERLEGRHLMIGGVFEPDSDEDLVGDKTEDVGDLTALRARFTEKRDDGTWVLTARVRNSGATVRHLPHIVRPQSSGGWSCVDPATIATFRSCGATPIAPGAEADVRVAVNIPGRTAEGRTRTTSTSRPRGPTRTPPTTRCRSRRT